MMGNAVHHVVQIAQRDNQRAQTFARCCNVDSMPPPPRPLSSLSFRWVIGAPCAASIEQFQLLVVQIQHQEDHFTS